MRNPIFDKTQKSKLFITFLINNVCTVRNYSYTLGSEIFIYLYTKNSLVTYKIINKILENTLYYSSGVSVL